MLLLAIDRNCFHLLRY